MAQFASDAFTGADGTELTAYSGNWVKHGSSGAGTYNILSNRCRAEGGAEQLYYHTGTPASADYTVSADFYVNSTSNMRFQGICARMATGANTYYYGRYSETTGVWQIFKRVAGGSFIQIGSDSAQTLSLSTSYNVVLSCSGTSPTSLELKVDTVSKVTGTDSDIAAAGKAGLRNNSGGLTAGMHIDNFSADDIVAAGGAGPIIKMFRLINGGVLTEARLVLRHILEQFRRLGPA